MYFKYFVSLTYQTHSHSHSRIQESTIEAAGHYLLQIFLLHYLAKTECSTTEFLLRVSMHSAILYYRFCLSVCLLPVLCRNNECTYGGVF